SVGATCGEAAFEAAGDSHSGWRGGGGPWPADEWSQLQGPQRAGTAELQMSGGRRLTRAAPTEGRWSEERSDESHAEATPHSATHPRLPGATWLFADDAGACRRTAGQQGYRVRARRGA